MTADEAVAREPDDGPDEWPMRSAIEMVWRAVIAGELTREAAHAWSVPWVEEITGNRSPADTMVGTGLQYLHGLDMTRTSHGRDVDHGGPGAYVLSGKEASARLDHWLAQCREYDADPEGYLTRAQELARAEVNALREMP